MGKARKLLLVSSSGGVLLDLLALEGWWSHHDAVWAAVSAADTTSILSGYRVHWIADISFRSPGAILLNFIQTWRILRRVRPELIISAGSGPAISFFILGRICGIPLFWLCTLNVIKTPGITARICARFASRVLLQQESMKVVYPNGLLLGQLY